MAGDKTYITDGQGKQHRATRVHAVTPTDIVWSSNPNDYSVQVKIDGKWHRAILTMDAGASTFFENVNIDKALVVGSDGKNHTALIVKPESTVTLSDIKTDEHALVSGTTTGETAVCTYSENWSNVKYQDNVNVYKVLVTGSDGKTHTALLTTSSGGSGGVEAIVLGTSPLALPDAVAGSLRYVKAFGGTKVGLPNGYTQMNGITNGANTYVNTGIKPAVDDVEIELRAKPTAGSWYIMQSRGAAIWGISGSSSGSTILLGCGWNSALCQSAITRDTTHTYYIKATMKNGEATLYVKDETAGTEDTQTATYTSSLPLLPFWLYGNQNNDRVNSGNTIYMARIKVGGETVMDYAPAINASNVVGFYDKATGNFVVSSAGTLSTDQPAVITPDAPMDIVSNNGALKYGQHGKNLIGGENEFGNLDASGQPVGTAHTYIRTKNFSEIEPNTQYVLKVNNKDHATQSYMLLYDENKNLLSRTSASQMLYGGATFTSPANAKYIKAFIYDGAGWENVFDWQLQLEKGSAPTEYEPYYFGLYTDGIIETIKDSLNNTATAEMLLSVDGYTDEQQILSGSVTRKVGVKVFDGTETFAYSAYGRTFDWYSDDIPQSSVVDSAYIACSHFQSRATIPYPENRDGFVVLYNTTPTNRIGFGMFSLDADVNAFKQWLAGQYAAGTPVIIVYPLVAETTESVAGQTLQLQSGNNTLEITQASLDGLELEAKYTKVA